MKWQIIVGLSCLMLVGACKSHQPKSSKPIARTHSKKEIKALSEKLNLTVTKKDNIHLYALVANWLGTPHVMGKCSKSGVDCSCFVQLVVQEVYQEKLPRTASEMAEATKHVKKEKLQEGHLVFFKIKSSKASHVGIYLKEGWFAHVSTSRGVMINNLSEKYYAQHYDGGGRY